MKFSKISADTSTFEFYYSELPEIVNDNIVIKNNPSIYKRKCLVDRVAEGADIYFRFISPTKLEYVVALETEIKEGKYISKIYSIDL